MSLPKINVPITEIEQPSTGKKIKFRPFLVKEEKILLMANEGDDVIDKLNSVRQIINNCSLEEMNVEKLPMFDVEYFFLKLREVSVGNTVKVSLLHPNGLNSKQEECNHQQAIELDLSTSKIIKNSNHTNKIKLDETYTLEMDYPRLEILEKLKNFNISDVDDVLKLVIECTKRLYTKDDVYDFKDYTIEEKMDFYGSLTQAQFSKIKDFFDTQPKIEMTVEYVCDKCGEKESIKVNGLSSFL